MPRSGGVYSKPAGTTAVSGTTIESSKYNQLMDDIVTDLNDARPVTAGGTGATTAGGAQTALKIAPYDGSATITGTWDMSGATLTMPTAMEVLNGSGITGLSGADATLITGTAGTDGYVPKWNADGDIVDGHEVLDEDDMASDSATALATQQSIKAYADGANATLPTTSGTAFDFTSLRAGINWIEVIFDAVSLDGSDNFLIQLGTGGSPTTSGYESACSAMASGVSTYTSTAGMLAYSAAAGAETSGIMRLVREPGTNIWVSKSNFYASTPGMRIGAGIVTLAGELDNLRLTRSGTNDFDGGSVSIRYR